MTVAVVVKVYDGIVLAADSATSLQLSDGRTQVYNNANKVFHLHRELPIAAMTWGLGVIGSASIATLMKDLRRRLMGLDPDYPSWKIDPMSYSIGEVADRYVEMVWQELYVPSFTGAPSEPDLGMLIAGFSAGEESAEAWEVLIDDSTNAPAPVRHITPDNFGWIAFAQPEATQRLFAGIDPLLASLIQGAVDPAVWATTISPLIQSAQRQPVEPAMPFGDAIDLAKFLVEATAQYSHFLLGPDTVGGGVDVAGVSRHEGYRWIQRKHYYPPELNPWGSSHDHH